MLARPSPLPPYSPGMSSEPPGSGSVEGGGARFESCFVRIPGGRVRVLRTGEGVPEVLLLASPVVDATIYRGTATALARHAPVAVLDLPCCGPSSRVDPPPSTAALADAVPHVLDALGARRVVVIGHSNSGPVALHAAVRHADRIAALVLVGSTGANADDYLLRVLGGRLVDAIIEWRLTLTGWPAIVRNFVRHPRHFVSQLRRAAGGHLLDIAPRVRVRVPTVLAWGARDHTMPLASARRLQAAIPHARLVVSGRGSHDWLIETADDFAHAVIAELRRLH